MLNRESLRSYLICGKAKTGHLVSFLGQIHCQKRANLLLVQKHETEIGNYMTGKKIILIRIHKHFFRLAT